MRAMPHRGHRPRVRAIERAMRVVVFSIAERCARMSAEPDARSSLLRELERLRRLSSRSVSVRSRSAVIERALELLAAASRSVEQDDELTRLLSGLAL